MSVGRNKSLICSISQPAGFGVFILQDFMIEKFCDA